MWGEIDCPTPAVLPNSSEKLGNNESAIRVLTDNSRCRNWGTIFHTCYGMC